MPTQADELAQLLHTHGPTLQNRLGYKYPGIRLELEAIYLTLQDLLTQKVGVEHPLLLPTAAALKFETFKSSVLSQALRRGRYTICPSGIQRVQSCLRADQREVAALDRGRIALKYEWWLYEPIARWLELVHTAGTHIALIPADGDRNAGMNADVVAVPAETESRYLNAFHRPCDIIAVDAKRAISRDWPRELANASTYYRFSNRVFVAYPISGTPVGAVRYFEGDFLRHAAKLGIGVLAVFEPPKMRKARVLSFLIDQLQEEDLRLPQKLLDQRCFTKMLGKVLDGNEDAKKLLAGLRAVYEELPPEEAPNLASGDAGAAKIGESYKKRLRNLTEILQRLGPRGKEWENARVSVVLNAQPQAITLHEAEDVAKSAWLFAHKRKHVLAQILRNTYGPWSANAEDAMRELKGYKPRASAVAGHIEIKTVIDLWVQEIERLSGSNVYDVISLWAQTLDTKFECDVEKIRRMLLRG